jgi:hypothetical protein
VSKHVDTGIQSFKRNRADDVDDDNGFIGAYVMPEEEEITRFGETHFGRIVSRYLSQHARGDRSIVTLYGIRRGTNGTFIIGDSPLSVVSTFSTQIAPITSA